MLHDDLEEFEHLEDDLLSLEVEDCHDHYLYGNCQISNSDALVKSGITII